MISKSRVYYAEKYNKIVVADTPKKYRKCFCLVKIEHELIVNEWGAATNPKLIYGLCYYIGEL